MSQHKMRLLLCCVIAAAAQLSNGSTTAFADSGFSFLSTATTEEHDSESPRDQNISLSSIADDDVAAQCCPPCCCSLCDQSGRTWTAEVGALFLHRSSPDGGPLISDAGIGGTGQSINARAFDFDLEPGVHASLIRHNLFGNRNDLQIRYFGVHEWSDTQFLGATGNPIVINTALLLNITGPRDITSVYESELDNVEANFRRRMNNNWITLLAGFRYLRLDESLHSNMVPTGPGTTEQFLVNTDNNLYGFQIGADIVLYGSCDCCIRGIAKAGLYGNDAGNRSAIRNPGGAIRINDSDSRAAFVGELGVTGTCRLTDRWNLTGSYMLLWIDGVALASDQVSASNFGFANPRGVNTSGDVFYHGFTVGLEFIY